MPETLTGRGCIAAIIDSGIDYAHPAFRDLEGRSRILALWDQTIPGNPPEGFERGSLYTREQIDEAISAGRLRQRQFVPSEDFTGHGTHVAGILAASCFLGAPMCGEVPEAELVIVKLGNAIDNRREGYDVSELQLIEALRFVSELAEGLEKPVGINLSYGNHRGPHTGGGPLSLFLNTIASQGENVVCIGTGNEGNTGRHVSGRLSQISGQQTEIEVVVNAQDSILTLSLWSYGKDEFYAELVTPDGNRSGQIMVNSNILEERSFEVQKGVTMRYLPPVPSNQESELRILFEGREAGIWKLLLTSVEVTEGSYDAWLTTGGAAGESRFLRPVTERTLTIPSDAYLPVAVGGYDESRLSLAPFSGRGYTRGNRIVKPDLVAPAVDILSASPGGGYTRKSGTSMATPYVTGAAIKLMQWGIVLGNDPLLFGQKAKAVLLKYTRKLPAYAEYPNPETGWGALDTERMLRSIKVFDT